MRKLVLVLAVFAPACDEDGPPIPVDAITVRILAADTTWNASYPGPPEIAVGREVHVPVGAEVRLSLASSEYLCIFSAPGVGLREVAAPGLDIEHVFRATTAGTYEVRGEELCGRPHTEKSVGKLVVEEIPAFREWIRKQKQEKKP